MGILDKAIREHLELKRQHGADDSELKQLEDDAFGPPQRPGGFSGRFRWLRRPRPSSWCSPTSAASMPVGGRQAGGAAGAARGSPRARSPTSRRHPSESRRTRPSLPATRRSVEYDDDGPADEEQPAGRTRGRPATPPASHSTQERHAIADQPTEMFDVERSSLPRPAPRPPQKMSWSRRKSPSPASLRSIRSRGHLNRIEETEGELELRAGDEEEGDEEDDFFDEQRLSDELDQALEAPLEPDEEIPRPGGRRKGARGGRGGRA